MSEEFMTVDITSQHIVINQDRSVAVPSLIKKSIVQRDHNIERLTFDCPRYWYGKDISTLNIYVNYISVSKKAKGDDPGSSLCENAVIDENDQDMMHFDWVITNNVSQDVGGLLFIVCAKSVDSDGNENVHWNSHLCKDLEVQEGLEASAAIVEKYPDVIEQIFQRLDNVDGVSPEQIAAAVEEYLVGNPPSGMTADEKTQLNKNTEDISSLSEEIVNLKENGIVVNREILPNVVLFGDSITDTNVNGEWVKNIEDYAEFKSLTNYARGYCTFTFKSDSEYNIEDTSNANIGNNVIWNQYNRMKADIDSGAINIPDCIIILGGTNDALQSKTIGDKDIAFTGSILDTDIKSLTNLYQSVRYVCETIKQNFPSTQIILCTPLQLGSSYNDDIISVHDAIVNSAKKMALKYIDQTYESGIYSYEEINGDVNLQNDNVHLSVLGGKLVAQFLAREFYNKVNLRYSENLKDEEPDTPIEPEVTLSSISVTYNGGNVTVGTELNALTGIKVTANYSDGTTAIVTDYTLSGEIVEGENIITVTYEELTTTFVVMGVVEEPIKTLSSISAQYTQEHTVIYDTDSLDVLKDDLVVTANYSDGNTEVVTDYTLSGTLKEGKSIITVEYEGKTTTFECEVTKYITSDTQVTFLRSELVGNMPTGIWGDNVMIPDLAIPRCQLDTFEFNANTDSGLLYVFVAKKDETDTIPTFTPLLVKEINAVKGFNSLELKYTPPEGIDEVYIGFKTIKNFSIGLNTSTSSAESTGQTWNRYYAKDDASYIPENGVVITLSDDYKIHNGIHINIGLAFDCLVRATIL